MGIHVLWLVCGEPKGLEKAGSLYLVRSSVLLASPVVPLLPI